jgi:hypothetical protein
MAHLSNYYNYPFLIVVIFVLNQSNEHWLLDDAIHSTISMSLKLKEEMKLCPLLVTQLWMIQVILMN